MSSAPNPIPTPHLQPPCLSSAPSEAEITINNKYAPELDEIATDILNVQQEQEDEEALHEANMTWLSGIGADGGKMDLECRRHEGEVGELLMLLRLYEVHLEEVVRARGRKLGRVRKGR